MGSATAFQLTEFGKKCLIIDQFPLGHTYGSSHGDSRIIRRSYPEKHFADLMVDAYALWHSLEKQYHEQFIVKTGGIDFGPQKSPAMKNVVATVNNLGLQHELLSGYKISQKFPAFSIPDDYYGLYQPDAGIVLASRVLNFFYDTAQKKGMDVVIGEKVSLIKEEQNHLLVSTKSKTFKTKKLVICAGSWINTFFKNYRIEHRTKILPVNFGYWKVKEPNQFKVGNFPIFISWGEKVFYGFTMLEKDGYIKVGAHYSYNEKILRDEDVAKIFDDRITNDLVSFIGETFPNAISQDYTIDACFYTMNDNENFILDFHPDNANIIFGGGFSGHGFKFAPLIGRILSELVINGKTNYPINKFTFGNF